MGRLSKLRRASFRGVEFNVEGIDDAYGRRTVTHVTPGYDTPFTEDMGKRPGSWSMQAFIIGDDYIERARELISACERPGAGYFVHPWLGGKQVICQECTPRWDFRGLGECRVSLTFQEEGEPLYPGSSTDYAEILKARAAAALQSFLLQFLEVFSLSGPEWLGAAMSAIFAQAMGMIAEVAKAAGIGSDALAGLIKQIQDAITSADELVDNPAALGAAVESALATATQVIARTQATETASTLVSLAALDGLTVPAPATAGGATLGQAAETFAQLVSRLAITHGIAAAMDAGYGSRDEALAARDLLVEAIDGLVEAASQRGEHEAFEALRQLRADLVLAFRDKAGNLPGVIQIPLRAPTPLLVVIYELYQDLAREAEVLGRNPGVHHPGFAPGGEALEVLDA